MLENNFGPSSENLISDVELPVDSKEKGDLVLVDLLDVEARDLAPGTCRVVAVLKILGSKDQGREEHAPAALKRSVSEPILVLLHSKATLGNVRLDEDEIVQRDLQGRVASARAPERLLDKGAQRQHGPVARLRAARSGREGPDGFNNLGRRVNKAIDEVYFAVRLPNK